LTQQESKITLALETAGRLGGVAILRGEQLLASGQISPEQRTAAAMTPLIKAQLEAAGVARNAIDLVAVTSGPGSFTGLRVGVTTAKTLAYVLGCDLVAVNTLSVIAQQTPAEIERVWAVVDAHRQQLFVAQYNRNEAGEMIVEQSTVIVDVAGWAEGLQPGDAVMGPGLKRLSGRLADHVRVVDASLCDPQAVNVGILAKRMHDAGHRDDFWKLVPQYFRQSAAEEKASN
jgi:tRNA threonylcarbamoyladenosine biosynthesis protein TsaB